MFYEVKARSIGLKSFYSFPRPSTRSRDEIGFIERIDALSETVGDVKGEITGGFKEMKGGLSEVKGRLGEMKDEMKGEMEGGFNDMTGEMKEGFNDMKGRLDKVAKNIQKSLMRLRNLQDPNYLYPHLVVVKEMQPRGTSSRAREKRSLMSKHSWSSLHTRLRGAVATEMSLHFVCPVDLSEVPCGSGGGGYRFRETRAWVKSLSPILQVAVVTAKVALKAVAGLDVDVSNFLNIVKSGMYDELVDRTLDDDKLRRVLSGEEDSDADMRRDTGASYEALRVFMEWEGRHRRKHARDGDGYVDFRKHMQRVTDGKGGLVWVRNENVQKWLDLHSKAAAPSR